MLLVVFVGYNKVFLVCWVLFIACCLLTWVLFWVGWGFLLVNCVITVLLALFGGYWSVIWCFLLVACCLFVCLALVVGYSDILGLLFGLLVAWGFLGLVEGFLGLIGGFFWGCLGFMLSFVLWVVRGFLH